MVHISLKYISGYRYILDGLDWCCSPSNEALELHYKNNKKNYKEGYTFKIQNIEVKVIKIKEKMKQQITFSC